MISFDESPPRALSHNKPELWKKHRLLYHRNTPSLDLSLNSTFSNLLWHSSSFSLFYSFILSLSLCLSHSFTLPLSPSVCPFLIHSLNLTLIQNRRPEKILVTFSCDIKTSDILLGFKLHSVAVHILGWFPSILIKFHSIFDEYN